MMGLCPGALMGSAKRWPAEKFVEATARVQRHMRCRWLVFGSSREAALAERVTADIVYEAERPPTSGLLPPDRAALNFAGRASLHALMALLKACRVLLTNDSGPMHLAAALGTPVVVPFGSTSPTLTGPGLPGAGGHQVLTAGAPCAPCSLRECPTDFRCMQNITVEQVMTAVVAALPR